MSQLIPNCPKVIYISFSPRPKPIQSIESDWSTAK